MTTTNTSPQDLDREPDAMGEMEPFDTYKAPRPGAVSALAVLQVLSGIALIATAALGSESLSEPLAGFGLLPRMVTASVLFGMLRIASGIGMWLGKRWGWWLAAFVYLYSILRDVSGVLSIPGMVAALGEPSRGVGYLYTREILSIGWGIFILIYWFREGVRDYFGLLDLSRLKAIIVLVAVAVLVVGAGSLFAGSADRELDRIARIYEEGDLDTAIEELEQYLESNPDDDMAWTILGHASLDADGHEDAEVAYDRAIEINPERHQAWTGLGILNRKLGYDDLALECYETALEIEPDDADAHSSLAILALQLYEDEKALLHAEKAHALDKRNPVIAANLAVVYHYNGMHDQRDEMTAEAERLGYEDVDILQMIYKDLWSIRE